MTRVAILLLALVLAGCGAQAGEPAEPAADPLPSAAAESIPATAVLVCGPDGASVETPEVAASRDGVHVEIRNESGAEQVVHVRAADSAQGEGFSDGTHTRVWALPPGPASVTCADPASDAGEQSGASFEVVDPDGVWVPTALDCDGDVISSTLDYFAGAPGLQGEPEEIVAASGDVPVAADDVVEAAGYPDAEGSSTVRVVRDGRVLTTVDLVPSEDGGWLVSTITQCAGG